MNGGHRSGRSRLLLGGGPLGTLGSLGGRPLRLGRGGAFRGKVTASKIKQMRRFQNNSYSKVI